VGSVEKEGIPSEPFSLPSQIRSFVVDPLPSSDANKGLEKHSTVQHSTAGARRHHAQGFSTQPTRVQRTYLRGSLSGFLRNIETRTPLFLCLTHEQNCEFDVVRVGRSFRFVNEYRAITEQAKSENNAIVITGRKGQSVHARRMVSSPFPPRQIHPKREVKR